MSEACQGGTGSRILLEMEFSWNDIDVLWYEHGGLGRDIRQSQMSWPIFRQHKRDSDRAAYIRIA